MIEWLIVVPVLLFTGLVVLQLALLMQARQALRLGALEAAREASVSNADPQAALRGLARGLAPWLYGAVDVQDALIAPLRAQLKLSVAERTGQLKITQLSPDESAFADWSEPARDALGHALPGVREIPNDALRFRSTDLLPPGGSRPSEAGPSLGLRSGQTLLQANLLRLQIDYAVPLRVPLAGPILARLSRTWQPEPTLRAMSSRGRLPIRVIAAVQMQSPARHAGPVPPSGSGPD
jgi:hypothetical protein